MDYFLQLFGGVSIGKAAVVIAALVFLYGCYCKVAEYFKDKAAQDIRKDDEFREMLSQVQQYPQWHQQSLDIRKELSGAIEGLNDKMDAMGKSLADIRKESQETQATTCRYRILRFDDEIRHDEHHSKEHFDQILDDITGYELYCEDHPDYKNNRAVMAIGNIKRVYQQCCTDGTFL